MGIKMMDIFNPIFGRFGCHRPTRQIKDGSGVVRALARVSGVLIIVARHPSYFS